MNQDITVLRDSLIEAALPNVAFDGWTWLLLENAACSCGYEKGMARAAFPVGISEAVSHFSDLYDRRMLTALDHIDPAMLRVRERVALAAKTRMKCLHPHKDAVRMALSYWILPPREARAAQALWATADRIWRWAGDTATDYNRYTKRSLLCGVLATTTLAWLNENDDPDHQKTDAFLDRRIENVMQIGKLFGTIKEKKRA
ncbi:MAG: COQ9 family protein [Alphaproteobacteria bacterium]|nr:COQ9 family protein [Alphaproteobacteria bacterium]